MTYINPILDTDSYKLSHFLGYPPDAEYVYSYAESRGGRYPATVFFGLQKYLRELAETRVTVDNVFEAKSFAAAHGEPFNEAGWMRIVDMHGGRIPVRIKAVAEGTLVPTRNVLVTVENTDPTMPWLTSYIETALLRAVWYPTTVATRIHGMKERIRPYYDRTSDSGDMGFGLLDFSARGGSSRETVELGGLAHLLSFVGSDNIPAILAAKRYYDEPMAAFSVPATEHSVTTSWGLANEAASIEYMIENMMPQNGILSLVGDTWNIYEFIRKVGAYKDRIYNKNGTIVIRPDSGEMHQVLPIVIRQVRDTFGAKRNAKGYDVISHSKVLQGDGIGEYSVEEPFKIAKDLGVSADSVMTGSGGGLIQSGLDRDTCKFAFKASNVTRSGIDYEIAKDPITDPGKRSKLGKLALVTNHGSPLFTIAERDLQGEWENQLRTVYENGLLFNQENLSEIRARLN